MKNKILLYALGLAFALSPLGSGSFAMAQTSCAITSLTSSAQNNTISSGQSVTLFWSSYGCTYLTLQGGPIYSRFESQVNGSDSTGPLTATTTFTLFGTGSGSSSAPRTITINVNGSVNGGSANVITAPPTNIGSSTVRLQGIALGTTDPFVGYFEIGKTSQFDKTTPYQYLSPTSGSYPFSDTVSVEPNTTYFYQAFIRVGQNVYQGAIIPFTTPSAAVNPVTYANGKSGTGTATTSTSSSKDTGTKNTAPENTVSLSLQNQGDAVSIGDTVAFTATYTNNTTKKLSGVVLSIVFPQGFTVKQTTQGTVLNPTTVTVDLKTLAPGQSGSVFIQTLVGPTTSTSDTLVTNGTLEYTLPDGTHDSAVGYVINHASRKNVLGGLTLGSGFFPTTIFGWLMTVIIILTIILLARRIAKAKSDGGHGHDAHH